MSQTIDSLSINATKGSDGDDFDELSSFGLGDLIKTSTEKSLLTKETNNNIDKLFDDFFSFGSTTTTTTTAKPVKFDLSETADESKNRLNESFRESGGELSLSDLANQHLSTTNSKHLDFHHSHTDTSDLTKKKLDKRADPTTTTTSQINLESLVIKKQKPNLPAHLSASLKSDSELERKATDHLESKPVDIKLIPADHVASLAKNRELLNAFYSVCETSSFGDIFSSFLDSIDLECDVVSFRRQFHLIVNKTNKLIENEFKYSSQVERFRRTSKKKHTFEEHTATMEVDDDNSTTMKPAKKSKPNESQTTTVVVVNNKKKSTQKSSSSSSKSSKSSSSSKSDVIVPFDFSIPSPDDVVIAKQKLSFKRFK